MIEGDLKAFVKSMEGSNYVVDQIAGSHESFKDYEGIIIAHNNRDFAYSLKTAFNNYPFSITLARNGAETILYAVENEPALVIVDPGLSIINGENLFRILRDNDTFAMLPVLFFANDETYSFVKEQVDRLGVSGILMENTPVQEIADRFAQILDVKL